MVRNFITIILTLWLLFALGSVLGGVFEEDSVLTILLAIAYVGVPICIFGFAYMNSNRFREFVLTLNLRTVILFETLRVIGMVFLVLYGLGTLPGLFALPAGIGDGAIGITAPFVALVLLGKRPFPKRTLMIWNLLGILDLLIALSLGIVTSPSAFALGVFASEITISPVLRFPLALIPAFGVPFTIILHLIAFMQIRKK